MPTLSTLVAIFPLLLAGLFLPRFLAVSTALVLFSPAAPFTSVVIRACSLRFPVVTATGASVFVFPGSHGLLLSVGVSSDELKIGQTTA